MSYPSDATPEVTVETPVSLLQGRRVGQQNVNNASIFWSVPWHSTQRMVEQFSRLALHVSSIKRHDSTWLQHTKRSCGHSKYHVSNFAKLPIALNKLIVQASVVLFVSDALLGMQASDDSFACHFGGD